MGGAQCPAHHAEDTAHHAARPPASPAARPLFSDMTRIVGFTFVSNAIRLDFPAVPAIHSILPLCEELLVNVGPSDDATLDLIHGIDDPRIRFIHGEWDRSAGSRMLSIETQRALDAARGDWAVYIQADEVLHEDGIPLLRNAIAEAGDDARIEGLLLDYRHFYGSFDWVATNRAWYRDEVRVVRLGASVHSFRDAQGFRVGPDDRRIRVRRTGAVMHHYGWARPSWALDQKRATDATIYEGREAPTAPVTLEWIAGLSRFKGTHPAVAREWIAARTGQPVEFGPVRLRGQLRLIASGVFEQLTGWRPFPYRNYVEV